MFWFNKDNQDVVFGDIRVENHVLCDGRSLIVRPDIQMDFTALPFCSSQFDMVVFDPPHFNNIGLESWMAKKYGRLSNEWRVELEKAFRECFRVLKPSGTLIFKWNETQIKVSEVVKLSNAKPLFGHIRVGKSANTHWMCFVK